MPAASTGAIAFDNEENPVPGFSDEVTVGLTDVPPTVVVGKTADPAVVGETLESVEFTITVKNTSDETVWITSMTDTVFGDLLAEGCETIDTELDQITIGLQALQQRGPFESGDQRIAHSRRGLSSRPMANNSRTTPNSAK